MVLRQNKHIKVYAVQIESSLLSHNGIIYSVRLPADIAATVKWERARRLMHGSLVCFSRDMFATEFLTGLVCMRDADMLRTEGRFMVKFNYTDCFFQGRDDTNIQFAVPEVETSYTMLETRAFFEPYRHVLQALVAFRQSRDYDLSFPFRDVLVYAQREAAQMPPDYLNNSFIDFM